jgi:hypothetical protein
MSATPITQEDNPSRAYEGFVNLPVNVARITPVLTPRRVRGLRVWRRRPTEKFV